MRLRFAFLETKIGYEIEQRRGGGAIWKHVGDNRYFTILAIVAGVGLQ